MEITNKISHFRLKLKFLAIFAFPCGASGGR